MKKIICFLLVSLSLNVGFAQIQRKINKMQSDSSGMVEKKTNMKSKMKELNLSREQKGKVKEMNQESKSSKDAIENDTTLNEQQKMKKCVK